MGICVRGVRGWVASCLILGGILIGAGGGTVLSTGAAVAQTVNSIVVEGNRRVEADTIRSSFRPGPNGRLGPEQEDEALKAMVATGLFSDVRISHSGGRIVVTVAEKRPTSTLPGTAVADAPSNVTHHSTIRARSDAAVPSSSTVLAVAATRASPSIENV